MREDCSAYEYIQSVIKDVNEHCGMNKWAHFEKYLDEFASSSQAQEEYLPEDKVFYRARLYLEEDRYKIWETPKPGRFKGYDRKNSFVNLSAPAEGRGNTKGVPYLYVSTSVEGAIAEVRPCAQTLVSVAKIKLIKPILIVDFDLLGVVSKNADDGAFECELFRSIIDEFSQPVYNGKLGSYKFTQCICEYICHQGFDGVKYNSALSDPCRRGRNARYSNLVIFNYEKCQAVSSKLYKIDKVIFEKHSQPQKA
jgi:hypothetical protein